MAVLLYPESTPFDSGLAAVGDGHQLYYERFGNPHGRPVVYLHGGPGAGCSFHEYRWFDPDHFQVILFNQRGSGDGTRKSLPNAHDTTDALRNNDIESLVHDIETLRTRFDIKRWDVCGGSFGSCLAMHYMARHPDSINRVMLRGIFFGTQKNALHITEGGSIEGRADNPYFTAYRDHIPVAERASGTLMKAYGDRVLSDDKSASIRAAQLFYLWDISILRKDIDPALLAPLQDDPTTEYGPARIWFHFCRNNFDDRHRNQLLRAVVDFPRPVHIIHGRQDYICAPANAFALYGAAPWLDLRIIENCGHGMVEEKLQTAFMDITRYWYEADHRRPLRTAPRMTL